MSSIPGSERSSGGGNGNPFQYSCLESPMDQGASQVNCQWGHEELDTIEHTSMISIYTHTYVCVGMHMYIISNGDTFHKKLYEIYCQK